METSVKYRAFISYSSKDREWADLIYKKLSHFRIPKKLREDNKWIRPIFQDTKQLAGGLLEKVIVDAVKRSDYLIVVCSTNACESKPVKEEIQTFINQKKGKYIIPFIVNGKPYSEDEDNECFPEPIRKLKGDKAKELLAINIKDMGEDAAITKVASRIINKDFALLWKEYERELRKRRLAILGFLLSLLVIFLIGFFIIAHQKNTLEKKEWQLMENQAKATAEKAVQLVGEGDALLAQLLSLNILPTKLSDPDRPYVPEADYCLRLACENQSAILRGHRNAVLSACFSPDGSLLATVEGIHDNGEVRIWDVRQGCLKHVINVGKFASSVSFSPDGNYLAFNRINELVLWDLKQMKEDMIIKVPWLISSIAFNPKGDQVILTYHDSHDGYLTVWDLESGKNLSTISGYYTTWANFTSDGNIIAPGIDPNVKGSPDPWGGFSLGPVVKISDAHTGQTIKQVNFNGSMRCLSGDGKFLISFDKCDAFIWDVQKEKLLFTLKGHNDWITSASFSFDGKYAITSSKDKTIKLWDAQTGALVKDLKGHENIVDDAVFSPDGRLIASVSEDCSVHIWDISHHRPSIVINNKDDWSRSYPIPIAYSGNQEMIDTIPFLFRNLTYNPDGQLLASIFDENVSFDESVRIWDSSNGEINQIIPSNELEFGHVLNICFNPINQELAVLLNHDIKDSNKQECVISFWNINKQRMERKVLVGKNTSSISFSSDGEHYVTSSDTNTVLWNAESYIPIDSSIHGGEAVFSPSSKYLVTTDMLKYGGKTLYLWNKDSISLKNRYDSISGYAFSRNDKYLALATSIKIVILDIESNRMLTSFSSLDRNQIMMFGPDGKYLYIYDGDGNISVRYAETGTLIYQMRESPRKDIQDILYYNTDGSIDSSRRISGYIGTTSLAFRPDGRQIAYSDGTEIRLWRFPLLQELIDETRERFSDRQLTLEERSRYYLKETNR